MTHDTATELRAAMRTHAAHRSLPVGVGAEELVAVSDRRRRRRQVGRFVGVALLVVIGVGGLVTVARERSAVVPATGPTDCPATQCNYVGDVAADGSLLLIRRDAAGPNIQVFNRVGANWIRVDSDLPPDFDPGALEQHESMWWLAGSLPDTEHAGVRRPAVATSTDGVSWAVQRLAFHAEGPSGFSPSAHLAFLAMSDSARLADAPTTELVPDADRFGDARICSRAVDQNLLTVEFCDGESLEASIPDALVDALTMRPQWASGLSDRLIPVVREPDVHDWDIYGSDGDQLLAILQRSDLTSTSTAPDGVTWTGTANLVCPDGSPGHVKVSSPVSNPAHFIVGGSCDDIPTIWSSRDSAETWLVTQPLGTTDEAVGTISKLSIDPSGATIDILDHDGMRHRFITRDTVTWEPIDAIGQVVGILPDAVITAP